VESIMGQCKLFCFSVFFWAMLSAQSIRTQGLYTPSLFYKSL
jgi:hypothetical protein